MASPRSATLGPAGRSIRAATAAAALACALTGCASTEVYFSGEGTSIHARIGQEIRGATESVRVAIYTFTADDELPEIQDALVRAHESGLDVRVCTDASQFPVNEDLVRSLESAGLTVGTTSGYGGGIMHNKYVVVDTRVVMTGSFNFTRSAELSNDENLLVLTNPALAEEYARVFDEMWEARCAP